MPEDLTIESKALKPRITQVLAIQHVDHFPEHLQSFNAAKINRGGKPAFLTKS